MRGRKARKGCVNEFVTGPQSCWGTQVRIVGPDPRVWSRGAGPFIHRLHIGHHSITLGLPLQSRLFWNKKKTSAEMKETQVFKVGDSV